MNKNYLIKRQFFILSQNTKIAQQYTFLKEIGKGSYGTVYLVKLKVFPHYLRAIKVVSKKKIKNPTQIFNEIKVMGKLDHPNIVRLYQTFQDQNYLYLVLDYCSGQQLYNRLNKISIFSEEKARYIFKQMVYTIEYLHNEKISHRDLKLQNFMMEDNTSWEIRLIDFGLSFNWVKDMKKQVMLKQERKLVGTSYYLAPEIILFLYDEKCDIWSLGVILYMMVTGSPPFDGESLKQIIANIKSYNYSLKTLQCSQLSSQLLDLLQKIFKPQHERISLKDIIKHPWMTVESTVQKPIKVQFDKIKRYVCYSKLKKLVSTYISANLSKNQIDNLRQTFLKIDNNQDGYLSIEQFHKYICHNSTEDISMERLDELMKQIDSDNNGKINYNQFITSCIDDSILQDDNYLKYVFNSFDLNRDGSIQRDEFNTILKAYSQEFKCNQELVDRLMQQNDKNKDGKIDLKQFINSIKQIRKLNEENISQ